MRRPTRRTVALSEVTTPDMVHSVEAAPGDGQVTLSWVVPDDGGSPITSGFVGTHPHRTSYALDLIAGTSTGSTIAVATAAEITMSKVVELFEKESPRISKRRRSAAFNIRSKISEASQPKLEDGTCFSARW